MCMTKTHNNMDSHLYKDVYDKNLKEYGKSFV